MRKSVTVSAPGKFHLIGEHSSVYGKPAILCAINKRLTVTVTASAKDSFSEKNKKAEEAIIAIRTFIQKKYKLTQQKHTFKINSDLPVGRGLGSSAALCAAVAGALFALYDLEFEKDSIFEAAYIGESVFHGNPSGGDLAVSVFGGVVWFRKETEILKLIKKLSVESSLFDTLLLIDSGKPVESTKQMVVDVVGQTYKKNNKKVNTFLSNQEMITKELSSALFSKNKKEISRTLFQAGKNLEKLGVVGKKAIDMIHILEKNGFVGKVSGGGGIQNGSGIIVASGKNRSTMIALCKITGWEYLNTQFEKEGVRID